LLESEGQQWDSSARPDDPAAPAFTHRLAANSPAFLLQLAAGGMGIAAADSRFALPYLADGRLEPVLPGWQLPPVDGWIVFPGRRLLPAKSRAFIEFLCQRLSPASGP
jgi:DNA-binding transcriptional LysR family regulator